MSVVQIARAVVSQAVCVEARVEWAVRILLRIFLMGRLSWTILAAKRFVENGFGIRLSYYSSAHDYCTATFAVILPFEALIDLLAHTLGIVHAFLASYSVCTPRVHHNCSDSASSSPLQHVPAHDYRRCLELVRREDCRA